MGKHSRPMGDILRYVLKNIRDPHPREQVDRHHIYPKSRDGNAINVHHHKNIIRLNHTIHFGYHDAMRNLTPQEQLVVWAEINKQVLSDKAKTLVKELWELSEEEFYDKELLIK